MTDLGTYDGRPVTRTSLALRNTGHGFEQTMKTEPLVIPAGSRRFVVMDVVIDKHRHDLDTDRNEFELVHMAAAETVAFIDEEIVREAIDKQKAKNDALKGRTQLETPDGVGMDVIEAHARGDHKRKRKDCPECIAEREEEDRVKEEARAQRRTASAERSRARARKGTGRGK